ncbi:hypothetical protein [Marinitoga lauensis]|uniref:hypothetical protein n=1 Tax=Marinitoga lauensis TaxID=2201189 RepID=UPI0010127501|nr:hypothetical protein [Marinitoga lauensis]
MKNGDKIYWSAYDPDGDNLIYEIYLGTSENNLNLVDSTILSEYILSNLEYGETYYWKIIAYDDKGGKTESEIKSFKTNAFPGFEEDKFYPSNNSLGIEKNVTLKWNAYDNNNDTLKYDLYFGTNRSNLTKIATDYIYNSYNLSALKEGTTYYWKIIAKDSYDGSTESEIMNFTTNLNPDIPEINYTLYNGLEASITWYANDPEGQNITYDLLKSLDDTDYSTILYNTLDKSYYASKLQPNTTYYWKVRAIDEKSDFSEKTISFTTNSIDTNIFTIERGDTIEENEIIDALVTTVDELIMIQKDGSKYNLIKLDSSGTQTDSNSISVTPKFVDYNNSNLLVIGISSNNIFFEEHKSDDLISIVSTSTSIPADDIKDYLKLAENQYLIVGNNSGDGFISKIDISDGSTLLNTKSFDSLKLNSVISIIDEDGNNKYIVCGYSESSGYLIKLDEALSPEATLIVDDMDNISKVIADGTYIVAIGFKNNDLIIKKYDYRLNKIWSPVYENNYVDSFADILKVSDGYLILLNDSNGYIEVIKLDDNLNYLSGHIFGRGDEDTANGIIKTNDGGYIIFGKTKSFGDTEYGNAYIIKTDSKLNGWSTPE